ncbi:MAG: type II toxin-antitoxin system RelE/ParE family toxin [Gemmatimonadota bacterium]|nr:MAG: type II toxin-antitoxin system RelE/ParE family toxin [Gemmatimonadota bacterium]
MEVRFRTRKLQKQYEKFREAEKAYGRDLARKYIERINIIKQAHDIKELSSLPGLHCHALKGDRQGEWSIKLTGFYRLIFKLEGELLEIACIEEVSKHYDD